MQIRSRSPGAGKEQRPYSPLSSQTLEIKFVTFTSVFQTKNTKRPLAHTRKIIH
jgi:hypothetical protein